MKITTVGKTGKFKCPSCGQSRTWKKKDLAILHLFGGVLVGCVCGEDFGLKYEEKKESKQ